MSKIKKKTSYLFCQNSSELENSLTAFFEADRSLRRSAVGNNPHYFVHQLKDGKHLFGLSKFCAFQDITLTKYLGHFNKIVTGGKTRKHIASLTGQSWRNYSQAKKDVQSAFEAWIHDFFPKYQLKHASFITLQTASSEEKKRKPRSITPEQLAAQLMRQAELGAAGEQIAIDFERQRLVKAGDAHPEIDWVSKRNVREGFDIYSRSGKQQRFIEVKASSDSDNAFFITSHEYEVLKDLKEEAFIYRVHVEDPSVPTGNVFRVIQNPIHTLDEASFTAVLYKVQI